jgi:hypothetical protein
MPFPQLTVLDLQSKKIIRSRMGHLCQLPSFTKFPLRYRCEYKIAIRKSIAHLHVLDQKPGTRELYYMYQEACFDEKGKETEHSNRRLSYAAKVYQLSVNRNLSTLVIQ